MKLLRELIKKLDKIIELLTEDKKLREAEQEHRKNIELEKIREEKERMLAEYARKHNKLYSPPKFHSTNELRDQPIRNAKDCIPFNLSETDKAILQMYYDKSDNREG